MRIPVRRTVDRVAMGARQVENAAVASGQDPVGRLECAEEIRLRYTLEAQSRIRAIDHDERRTTLLQPKA